MPTKQSPKVTTSEPASKPVKLEQPKLQPPKLQLGRSIPLRLILIAPFIMQIFAAVGLTSYLSISNGQKAVNDLAKDLRQDVSARVAQHITSYLEKPWMVNQLIADAVDRKQLNLDLENIYLQNDKFFLQTMRMFNEIGGVFIGTPEHGSILGGRRDNKKEILIAIDNQSTGFKSCRFRVNEQDQRTALVYAGTDKFDARTRPWYKKAVQAKKPVWSDIYPDFNNFLPIITASSPIFDRQNNLLAVSSANLNIENIITFLKNVHISKKSEIFIIERNANIVASSTDEKPFIINDPKQPILRLSATSSNNPATQAATKFLQNYYQHLSAINVSTQHEFYLEGERQFLQVTPFKDQYGLDWLIVVVVPESDFMEQINANTRTTIFLCILALILAIISGIYTSHWILQPINRLNQASQEITRGNLNQEIQPESIKELNQLGEIFNEMSNQLQASFCALSQTNTELEKRVEERTIELKQSKEEAEFAKQIADNANQAKSEFLANMSHELRTPLNGILGYAQILGRSKAIPEKEKHGVNIIHQCGSHLLTLINDVLDIAKIEARKLELVPSAIHLPSLVQGVVEISQIRAQQKGIDFYYTPDPNLPSGVIADEKRLRQVLINLLGNAIKFTDQGSVTLQVKRLNSNIEPNSFIYLRFSVIDTGVGISEENIQKLFQAFQQVGDRSRQAEGTGLGLAISQQIVQLMGGEIKVESTLGVGSKFFFEIELPLKVEWVQQQQSQAGNIVGAYGNTPVLNGDQKQILVIDDRWENRAVITNLLEPIGFVVRVAENGKEGLEKMRENHPDLIITDLAMPVMDGFEFLKELRNDPKLKHLKVLVSSASVAQLDQQMSLDAGADDFLAKPVNAPDLFNLLAHHLQLTWNYEEVEAINEQEMIFPPATELEQIYQGTKLGDMDMVINEANRLEQLNPQYKPFVTRLIDLADEFDDAGILKFIEPIRRSL